MQWTKTLPNGKKISYVYEELPGDGAIVGAHVEGDNVGIAQASKTPMTREEVEAWAKSYAGRKRD